MAEGILVPLVAFWKEWGILPLMLFSFALQVILAVTAEIRRRKDSGVLKMIVWSAYLLADTTAVYTLGHMSVTSTTLKQEHQLMAFWASFLLLHLGGQDNITAYSIEDNRLWLRHFQVFVVQVMAAAYVLYQSSILARRTLLSPAAVLIFLIGSIKYGERVCALRRASSGSILYGRNYNSFLRPEILDIRSYNRIILGEGQYLHRVEALAMQLLDYPKNLLKGPLQMIALNRCQVSSFDEIYRVAEVQLSLMHDLFYTKDELIHTWHGYFIRAMSLLGTLAALLLFRQFSEKDEYKAADVTTTYILLSGALILETMAVIRAMLSIWSYPTVSMRRRNKFKTHVAGTLSHLIFRFRCFLLAKCVIRRGRGIGSGTGYWSGYMGQHDFIHMISHSVYSPGSKLARWMGWEDLWNMIIYPYSIPVSRDIIELLKEQLITSTSVNIESPDHIQNSRGRAVVKRTPRLHQDLGWLLHMELDESIIVWHIATSVFLNWNKSQHGEGQPQHLAEMTQKLSNYLFFLLTSRPHMLPGNISRRKYIHVCHLLSSLKYYYRSEAELLRLIQKHGNAIYADPRDMRHMTFARASLLGAKLIREATSANILELISQVWVELLCYVAYNCMPDSHARNLSNGGEFTTVVAILMEFGKYGYFGFGIDDDEERQLCNDYIVIDLATDARGDPATGPGVDAKWEAFKSKMIEHEVKDEISEVEEGGEGIPLNSIMIVSEKPENVEAFADGQMEKHSGRGSGQDAGAGTLAPAAG